jgi:4-amino-4-deoxy-L-arabinose transferase-like glycosyltransferase
LQPLSLNTRLRNCLLLFTGCVLFHVLGTWTLPLIDRDEPRFAEASREMRERRDWVVPYFNGQYRFDKPPLTYWAQVGSYEIFGETDFAARFPSAIAAALTALVVYSWGTRIGRERVGWWGAIIFTLSLQTFLHAKAAVADMWLVLFMTLAFWSGAQLFGEKHPPNGERSTFNVQRPKRRAIWWWSFYISLALAFLAKGPIGLIPLVPAAWLIIREGNGRPWQFAAGLLVTATVVSLWAIPAIVQTNGEFLRVGIGRHVIGRSIGAMEGHGAGSFGIYLLLLPFYFLTAFISLFPWSVRLPWLVGRVRRSRDATDNYLLVGIISVFGIFTLVATKLPHYTLPAFPLIAILLARHWVNSDAGPHRGGSQFNAIAISTFALWIVLALTLPPFATRYFPSYVLFQKCRDDLHPNTELAAAEFNEPSLVWYFRSRSKAFLKSLRPANVVEFTSRPGPGLVVLPTQQAARLFPKLPSDCRSVQTTGFNIPKGKKVDLTVLLKPN